jgi:hypothetical protein
VLTLLPTAVFAQSAFDLGGTDFKPYVKIGYERLGVNFSLPGNWNYAGAPPPSYPGSLEMRIEDSYAWVGAIGVTVEFSRGLSAFLNGEGIAPKNVTVSTASDPLAGMVDVQTGAGPAEGPIEWTGTRMERWSVEGGPGYRLMNGFSFICGLRHERLSLRLDDPRDAQGRALSFYEMINPVFEVWLKSAGDFSATVRIPYVGVAFSGPGYRGTLLWSPAAYAEVKAPVHWSVFSVLRLPFFRATFAENLDWRFSAFSPGTYLEARFEYENEVTRGFAVKPWGRGRMLKIQGGGGLGVQHQHYAAVPWAFFVDYPTESNTGGAAYSSYSSAVGATALLNF